MTRPSIALLLCAAVAMLCRVGIAAADTQVTLNIGYEASGFNGGEFNVSVDPTHDALGYVTRVPPKSQNPPASFATFCLQQGQYFMPTKPYTVEVATATNHTSNLGLSNSAAWLFHVWNNKLWSDYSSTLGYDYVNAAQRASDAQAFQQAIWYFQLNTSLPSTSKAQGYITLANLKGWGPGRQTNIHSVRVMRLYRIPGVNYGYNQALDAQDQLFETPESGSIVLLACGTLGALPLLRRRRAV